MNKVHSLLFALPLLILASCSGGGGSDSSVEEQAPGVVSSNPLGKITTFNVGLLPGFVARTEQRLEVITNAVANSDAQVLCLQEVWRDSDRARIKSAAAANFPFQFEAANAQRVASSTPACTLRDFEDTFSCLLSKCLLSNQTFRECAIRSCQSEVQELANKNPTCAAALFAQTGRSAGEVFDIQSELLGDTPAPLFSFDGSSGLLLLSRLPLSETQVLDFADISTTSRRAALFASVEVNGERQVVGCTHLASNLDGLLPYTGTQGSFEGEGQAQAVRMLQFTSSFSAGAPTYLAGDFNCSIPNSALNTGGDFESVCNLFLGNSYLDPAASALSCSFCAANSLNQQNPQIAGGANLLLDHVFTRNIDLSTLRVEAEFVATSSAIDGNNISDHFGISLVKNQ